MATILLAEDHATTRELLAERLIVDGHRVFATGDALGAYEQFATLRPDLVIASIALPEVEGRHLFVRLREAARRVPLLVYDLGHRGTPRGMRAILPLGANAYLPDPTRHEALKTKIAELLAPKQAKALEPAASKPGRPGPVAERASRPQASGARARKQPPRGEERPEPEERPLNRGELRAGILAELLIDAWKQGASATIRLSTDEGIGHAVRIEEGKPVGISSSDPSAGLTRWLQREGRIEDDTAKELLDLATREGLSPAGALVATGVVEAGPPLLEILTEHAQETLVSWFALKTGRFVVTQGAPSSREFGPSLSMAPLPLVREGARRFHRVSLFQRSLGGNLDRYPFRVEAFRTHLAAMELSPKEITFAMKLTGEVKTRDLLADARTEFKGALLALWFLHRVGTIDFSDTTRASAESEVYHARASRAGRKKKPLPKEEAEALCEEALRMVTASYFGVLGVDIDADIEDVERAYYDIATRFHPESFEEYDIADIEDLLQTVLDRAAAAYRVLSIEEKRKDYLSFLLSRQPTTARRGEIVADAEIAQKKGLRRLEEGDAAGAVEAFQQAAAANPKEPAYLAHLAYAKFRTGHGPAAVRAKEPRSLLKKALHIDPDHEHANLVSALVEIACGRRDEARAFVFKALRRNPKSESGKALLQRINRS